MNCYSRCMVEMARITKMGNIAASSYTDVVCANKLCAWKNNHHRISNEFSSTSFYPFVPDHFQNKIYWKYLSIKYWKGLFTSNMASFPKQCFDCSLLLQYVTYDQNDVSLEDDLQNNFMKNVFWIHLPLWNRLHKIFLLEIILFKQ